DRLAGLERRTQNPGIRTDRERAFVIIEAARKRNEAPRTVTLREGLRAPRRRTAALRRHDPDLEDPRRCRLEIVFGVADAGSGTHHLHVAGFGTPLVAETVLVRDSALAHIGDDLHVGVGMGRKARIGGDLVIVPYPQRAPAHAGRVGELAEREV